MKRITGLAAGVVASRLMAGPGFAADTMQEPTSTQKPGKLAMPHRVTGNAVSVDESAGTFTVEDTQRPDGRDEDRAGRLDEHPDAMATPGRPPGGDRSTFGRPLRAPLASGPHHNRPTGGSCYRDSR
jgi:hypothetical protein